MLAPHERANRCIRTLPGDLRADWFALEETIAVAISEAQAEAVHVAGRAWVSDLRSAGGIEPGPQIFVVAWCAGHKTLRRGDRVCMVEDSTYNNRFVRAGDNTIHNIDIDGQYVLVLPEHDEPIIVDRR